MLNIALAAALCAPGTDRGNVLWIVLDDISIEYIEVYGEGPEETQPPTPNIDALARRGLRFDSFYVNPVCSPTRATLLTGEYAWRSGVGDVDAANELPVQMTTLPEALHPVPSVLFGVWKLGRNRWGDLSPVVHGYDLYAGRLHGRGDYYDWTQTVAWRWSDRDTDVTHYRPSREVDQLRQMIKLLPEPWHLTWNSNSAHKPLQLPPSHLHSQTDPQGDQQVYMAMVEAVDTEIGRLMKGVDLETTTVFVLSDNGSVAELTHPPSTGKGSTLEGGVNCPLIAVGRRVPKGESTAALANSVDLFETTLELTGRAGSHDPQDGVSLMPVLENPKARVRDWVFGELFSASGSPDLRYARDDRYKLRARYILGEPQFETFHDLATADPGTDGPALNLDGLDDEQRKRLEALRVVLAMPER